MSRQDIHGGSVRVLARVRSFQSVRFYYKILPVYNSTRGTRARGSRCVLLRVQRTQTRASLGHDFRRLTLSLNYDNAVAI